MRIKCNLHTHTTYCDGKNSPEEMVLAAIANGYDTLGFSVHGYTPFDTSYCIRNSEEYAFEIDRLAKKFEKKIKILIGVEADYYGNLPDFETDYTIGAVHYVKKNDKFIPLDLDLKTLSQSVEKYYGGDVFGLITDYYLTLAEMVNSLKPNIIAHFDLLNKFNANNEIFNAKDERYIKLVRACCEKIKGTSALVEINVGNMMKSNAAEPYPCFDVLKILMEYNFNFCFALDAHSVSAFQYDFSNLISNLKKAGLKKLTVWKNGEQRETNI